MPIYEYQCTNCHHHFDLMQKIGDDAVTQCPQCSKDTVIKLISATGFQLKGTGWYATDFKTKSTSSEEKSASPTDTPKKTDSETSSSKSSD